MKKNVRYFTIEVNMWFYQFKKKTLTDIDN